MFVDTSITVLAESFAQTAISKNEQSWLMVIICTEILMTNYHLLQHYKVNLIRDFILKRCQITNCSFVSEPALTYPPKLKLVSTVC
jgi:hypothetical protein